MAAIRFDHVSKAYADGRRAVDDLTLEIADGEFLVLVGPSGCGKSTALRMIAGLEDITDGQLSIGGVVANAMSPRQRNVAMIFQSYALYPHLSVAENLGFALKVRKTPQAEKRVGEAAAMLELTALLARRPGQLSGGQRQRVAMGRALVRDPNAFLMDEPLSNLDARLRGQMRVEITRLQRAAGVTTVYVTHDQIEAMTMGDRVAVMRGGVLQQWGAPRTLYDHPVNLFVAAFMGSPPISLLQAALQAGGDGPALHLAGAHLTLTTPTPGLTRYFDRQVIVGVRAETLGLTEAGQGALDGIVAFQEDLGASVLTTIDLAPTVGDHLVEDLTESEIPKVGSRLKVNVQADRGLRPGAVVGITLDVGRLLFFDPVTKLAIG